MNIVLKNLVFLLLAFFCSCTILEDRTPCPSWIEVDLLEFIGQGRTQLVCCDGEKIIVDDVIEPTEDKCVFSYEVERKNYNCAFSCGISELKVDNHLIYRIPVGEQMERMLGFFARDLLVEGDKTVVKPVLRKQFCTILMRYIGIDDIDYRTTTVQVSSSTEGINLKSLSPVEGNFSVERLPGGDGEFSITVPRQCKDDLIVELFDEKKQRLCSHNITLLLREAGYDWNALSLQDAALTLNITSSDGGVHIGDWSEGGEFTPEF